jgi:hypothetical protein
MDVPQESAGSALASFSRGDSRFGLSDFTPRASSFWQNASMFSTSKPIWSSAHPLAGKSKIYEKFDMMLHEKCGLEPKYPELSTLVATRETNN